MSRCCRSSHCLKTRSFAAPAAVRWGRAHVDLSGVLSIGVDEIQYQLGHKYLTLVYQIDGHCKRLLWIGKERTEATIDGFFDWFGQTRSEAAEAHLQ